METARYRVILADPPWTFRTYSAKGKGRSADVHYDCMTIDEIKNMPVRDMADEDCVLFMWTTDPFLRISFDVLDAWGFTYKTVAFYWAKSSRDPRHDWPIGTGYWTRANPEQCLLATRGRPRRKSTAVRKLIVEPKREHSRKPACLHERIEALCDGPYLELFARDRRAGWDQIGDQLGIFDGDN